jgi:hypothetical protein
LPSRWRIALAAVLGLGFVVGTAAAAVLSLAVAGHLSPTAQAAPAAQCVNWPTIGGTWYREGDRSLATTVNQVNNRLTLTNEFGSVANAELVDDVSFTVTASVSAGRDGNQWAPGLTATLTNLDGDQYRVIDWGNGTTWQR